MDPVHSHLADEMPRNAPRDMLSRLYREIGVAAVAAALEEPSEAVDRRTTVQGASVMPGKQAA